MGTQYLIDSNVIIDYLSGVLPSKGMDFLNEIVNDMPRVSVISKIEVLGYITPISAYQLLMNFMADADILQLSEEIVSRTIEIRKAYKIKLPDAIIAATALVNGYALVSRNLGDFEKIEGLNIIDPHSL
jgi:hypothetical protein